MSTKLILTNFSQLAGKYGAGFAGIQAEVQRLITADQARGLATQLIGLDDAAAMQQFNASPVTNALDPKQNKTAIDGVYKALLPEYMMILGAQDVVPHQDLSNPAYEPEHSNDADMTAYGDLPYACEAPYSQDPQSFTGATRVVGRLPDLPGASDPEYLVGLLKTAATWTSRSLQDYSNYLGLSAQVWQQSTSLSLSNLFGSGGPLHLSPTEGPNWTDPLIGARSHFINCHGAPGDFQFYGQSPNDDYPISHSSINIEGRVAEGTVVAAECCYGAQLFDPTLHGKMGICSAYLRGKAYGFWGSSTIAYGPSKGNGQADLICQYFLKRVLAGSSLGRAALEARQSFAQSGGHLDPFDLKTLAQFSLLGDPSIHPVNIPIADVPLGKSFSTTTPSGPPVPKGAVNRSERRRQLLSKGLWIAENTPVARRARARRSPKLKRLLEDLASQTNMQQAKILSFNIDYNPKRQSKTLKNMVNEKSAVGDAVHVVLGQRAEAGEPADSNICRAVAVVAKEVAGEIDSYRVVFGK
ncbi:MAG TPA: hypothetical protein VGJ57_05670 [Nitrospirales bacterium]|jgi:hypothetical protein